MKPIFVLLATILATSLTACGGGGGGSATTPVAATTPPSIVLTDKYTGTWSNCSNTGVQTTVVVTKNKDNFYTANYEVNSFSAPACTGTSSVVANGTGTWDFQTVGTKTELGLNRVVDKTLDLADGSKGLIYTNPNVTLSNGSVVALLYFEDEYSALDADGFPQSLDNMSPLQKR
jgi:hypothetical protein